MFPSPLHGALTGRVSVRHYGAKAELGKAVLTTFVFCGLSRVEARSSQMRGTEEGRELNVAY
jgi:hypothetical protein